MTACSSRSPNSSQALAGRCATSSAADWLSGRMYSELIDVQAGMTAPAPSSRNSDKSSGLGSSGATANHSSHSRSWCRRATSSTALYGRFRGIINKRETTPTA